MQKLGTLNQGPRGQIFSGYFQNLSGYFQNHVTTLGRTAREHPCLACSCRSIFVLVLCSVLGTPPVPPVLQRSLAHVPYVSEISLCEKKHKAFQRQYVQTSYKGLKRKKASVAAKLIHKHIPNWLPIKHPATLSRVDGTAQNVWGPRSQVWF